MDIDKVLHGQLRITSKDNSASFKLFEQLRTTPFHAIAWKRPRGKDVFPEIQTWLASL